jgi:hypothetical protein
MVINTYFTSIAGMESHSEILKLWELSWRRRGWTTRILTVQDAQAHPRYNEFVARVDTYPTVNNREYERACYIRWLALVSVGGGWMSDTDTINFSFSPQIRKLDFEIPEPGYCPCLAWLKPRCSRPVDLIMEYGPVAKWPATLQDEASQGHISDMLIFQYQLQAGMDLGDPDQAVVCEYNEVGWRGFPLTHFCAGRTVREGFESKSDAVRRCGRVL